MEQHKILDIKEKYNSSLDQDYKSYFEEAKRFTLKYYSEDVERISNTNFSELTPEKFLLEQTWCICVSGFRASVVSKFFDRLYGVLQPLFNACIKNQIIDIKYIETRALQIFNNKMKIGAIIGNTQLVGRKISELGWENYRDSELNSAEKLEVFKMVGPKISLHLGRNIGLLDNVKPDIHMRRLADKFGFSTPNDLCASIAKENNMKKGIIDLIFWYYASSFGSK
jgi:hypothetical protein